MFCQIDVDADRLQLPEQSQRVYVYEAWRIDLGRRELRAHGELRPLGERAFDVLALLVLSAGALVTKNDVFDAVWSGSAVEENTLQVHISAIRRALGQDRGLLKTVVGRGYRLEGEWGIAAGPAPAPSSDLAPSPLPRSAAGRFPVADSDLIGREAAVQTLLGLMSRYRIVTLTGPGGIGKTRLAQSVVQESLATFTGGAFLVELGVLSEPHLVAATVASALGFEPDGDGASLARAIGGRRLLLMLDSCEHVIDAAARLAATLTGGCPGISLLVTSRESLRIEGECVYRVPPLDVPPVEASDQGDVFAYSAVRLFAARLTAADTALLVAGDDIARATAICRRLDGIPLAIELAASRAASLGIAEVLARLDDRFALLAGGWRTALPRHQTLRATLDWSYEMLPPSEQHLLRHLAVFAGGFTTESVQAVIGESGEATGAVLDGISNLSAKSLVGLDTTAPAGRWRLLETVRAYAAEKLAESGETNSAARRHARFLQQQLLPMLASRNTELRGYAAEMDNVRAACDWCLSASGDTVTGVSLTADYAPIWLRLSLVSECRTRTERALRALERHPAADTQLRTQLEIALAATLLHSTGAEERTASILARSLEAAETSHDHETQLRALWAMWSYRHNGEHQIGRLLAERFAVAAQAGGNRADILVADRLLAATLHYEGDQPGARRHLQRVVEHYVTPHGQRHTIWFHHDQQVLARAMLARIMWQQGYLDQARTHARASQEAALAIGHRPSLCFALAEAICPQDVLTGDLAAAEHSIAMFSDVVERYGFAMWLGLTRCLTAALQIRRGDAAAGTATLRRLLNTPDSTGLMVRKPEFLGILAEGLIRIGQIDDAVATLDAALALADGSGQSWYVAELLRSKAEALLRIPRPEMPEAAEHCFRQAFTIAREQGALLWELRVAVSVARLRMQQDRHAEARSVLGQVYQRFTEGFDAADLVAARNILDAAR